jgi:exopolysaccharide biosynthesis WecB/TagA/CpsF family protein
MNSWVSAQTSHATQPQGTQPYRFHRIVEGPKDRVATPSGLTSNANFFDLRFKKMGKVMIFNKPNGEQIFDQAREYFGEQKVKNVREVDEHWLPDVDEDAFATRTADAYTRKKASYADGKRIHPKAGSWHFDYEDADRMSKRPPYRMDHSPLTYVWCEIGGSTNSRRIAFGRYEPTREGLNGELRGQERSGPFLSSDMESILAVSSGDARDARRVESETRDQSLHLSDKVSQYQYCMRGANLVRRLRLVTDEAERTQIVHALRQIQTPLVVSFLNAHAFNLAWKNPDFNRYLAEADVLFRDGVGMSMLLTLLGIRPGVNMDGTDLIPQLLKDPQHRIALLGTCNPFLSVAAARLIADGLSIGVTLDGFQTDECYVNAVCEARPSMVILAMGMPKQERVAHALKQRVTWPCLIINGGAILDFISGRVRRAPTLVRSLRLEWAYRLALEPRRLWRRYVIGNLVFLMRSWMVHRWVRAESEKGNFNLRDDSGVGEEKARLNWEDLIPH